MPCVSGVGEMERRYRLMSRLGVRNIGGYNRKVADAEEAGEPMQADLGPGDRSMDRTRSAPRDRGPVKRAVQRRRGRAAGFGTSALHRRRRR